MCEHQIPILSELCLTVFTSDSDSPTVESTGILRLATVLNRSKEDGGVSYSCLRGQTWCSVKYR